MPTDNRRVATYLPKNINERFEAFKAERDIKGDSQALIVILSEFLGIAQQVAQPVDYQSNFATKHEVEELRSKLSQLFEQVQYFEQHLNQVASELVSESRHELLSKPLDQREITGCSSNQLALLQEESQEKSLESSTPSSNIPSELLSGLTGVTLTKRLQQKQPVGRRTVENHRDKPDFPIWSSKRDPDGVAWEYREKKYYPLTHATSDSLE